MLRFIDLREQSTGHRFAFWDTVTDRFCEFFGEQAWDTFEDFAEAFKLRSETEGEGHDHGTLNRFKGLCPEWAMSPDPDPDLA